MPKDNNTSRSQIVNSYSPAKEAAYKAMYRACTLALTTPGMVKGRDALERAVKLADELKS